ncbi:BAD_collapsed_G0017990.mRNA.1.CDS.1 [Saccharomyces cerevisiae]|nr:BAD_collapsed_G0017990.mRNA.1.CDS.1 [Saccharomyces cerevisiae]
MANFMTMMISLEHQLYLSINALQLAVALNLNDNTKCMELLESNSDGIGVILLFGTFGVLLEQSLNVRAIMFKSSSFFSLYRPYLITGESSQAVTMAKSIIHEIWSQYTKQFPDNEKGKVRTFDWNFVILKNSVTDIMYFMYYTPKV